MAERLPCPRCPAAGLVGLAIRGVHLHACGDCGGVWLAPAEAARIFRPLFPRNGAPGRPSSLRCPGCARTMTESTVHRSTVVIDACAEHGTWFDRQEIEQLSRAAAEMRGRPAPEFVAPGLDVATDAATIAVDAAAHADEVFAGDLGPGSGEGRLAEAGARVAIKLVIKTFEALLASLLRSVP